ncbi:hypothetical protein [Methylobacillus sp.]|uniref:hypothetical protein n=1 Tax=Methylobacillus sp. TaxID=56818 RepID=UPI0012D28A7E|nr:hypothetical protein [Methylobacillus sp.]MPS48545.1 hypothetical protein [Methylobacillus sp.]
MSAFRKVRFPEESSYHKFTGSLGLLQFVDGVSVNEVSKGELDRIACGTTLVDDETGWQIGPLAPKPPEGLFDKPVAPEAPAAPITPVEPAAPTEPKSFVPDFKIYTLEELSEVADKKGIAGLRAIAEPFGVKNASIKGLIDEFLQDQAKRVSDAEAAKRDADAKAAAEQDPTNKTE